jgi:glycerol-3-phosphate dehydrogenase (NAD(P)+)
MLSPAPECCTHAPLEPGGNYMARVAVIGAGSWGTALALVLARKGCETRLWAHNASRVDGLAKDRENATYLPGFRLPDSLEPTADLTFALDGAEMVVVVTPSHTVRDVMGRAAGYLPREAPIVSASKGIEQGTLMMMSEVLEDVLPTHFHPCLTYLSGPSFAKEVAAEIPTAVTVAGHEARMSARVQELFTASYFRVYTTEDVTGVELGGAIKNVMAIAAGVADGLGYGHNTRAALMTRGIAEIGRLAMKKGANPLTLAGLSGMGDLVLTCTGELSRNRSVGVRLGRGDKLPEILADMKMVAEGVKTTKSAHDLAKREGVEMPIVEQVYRILYEDKEPRAAVSELMGRLPKHERATY